MTNISTKYLLDMKKQYINFKSCCCFHFERTRLLIYPQWPFTLPSDSLRYWFCQMHILFFFILTFCCICFSKWYFFYFVHYIADPGEEHIKTKVLQESLQVLLPGRAKKEWSLTLSPWIIPWSLQKVCTHPPWRAVSLVT